MQKFSSAGKNLCEITAFLLSPKRGDIKHCCYNMENTAAATLKRGAAIYYIYSQPKEKAEKAMHFICSCPGSQTLDGKASFGGAPAHSLPLKDILEFTKAR